MFSDLMRLPCERTLSHRTPGGGNAATGRWQCCHWAVAVLPPGGVRWQNRYEQTGRPSFKHDNQEVLETSDLQGQKS